MSGHDPKTRAAGQVRLDPLYDNEGALWSDTLNFSWMYDFGGLTGRPGDIAGILYAAAIGIAHRLNTGDNLDEEERRLGREQQQRLANMALALGAD